MWVGVGTELNFQEMLEMSELVDAAEQNMQHFEFRGAKGADIKE